MEGCLLLEAGAPCPRRGSWGGWPCSSLRRKGFVGSRMLPAYIQGVYREFAWRACSLHRCMVGRKETTQREFQTGFKEFSHFSESQATGCAVSILGGFWDQAATESVIASCLLNRRLDWRPSDLLSNLNYPVLIVCQYCVKLVGLSCIFIQQCDNRCRCTFFCLKESAFNSGISSLTRQFARSSVKQGRLKLCCERCTAQNFCIYSSFQCSAKIVF